MSITLLQQIGLNKYEAEAYTTLLTCGPLTGYELGKRSQVPASRSYDVLERLCQQGLALVQPGEPARYRALEPTLLLNRVRVRTEEALAALASSLSSVQQPGSEFWVVRGRQHILDRVQELCTTACQSLKLTVPTDACADLAVNLAQAQRRDIRLQVLSEPFSVVPTIALLADERQGLLGTLTPDGQAILSQNPALLALLAGFFRQPYPTVQLNGHWFTPPSESDWLAWEQRKHQRLRVLHPDGSLA